MLLLETRKLCAELAFFLFVHRNDGPRRPAQASKPQ
jgi:hypothetical protein